MMRRQLVLGLVGVLALGLSACKPAADKGKHPFGDPSEVGTVAVGYQNGLAYAPFHVMKAQGLVEKEAERQGVKLSVDYRNLGQAAFIRDALIAGQIQFGVAGPPTLVTMHEKTGGDIKAVAAVVSVPILLNTTAAHVKTVCDFREGDKIALPTVKSSVQAVTLQKATEKACGDPFKADRYTVSMPHPDGYNALMTGMVNTHMTTPPFSLDEISKGKGKVRTISSSYDVWGGPATLVYLIASDKFREANPKAYNVMVKAFEQAEAFVREHPREAAQIYIKAEKSKQTVDEVAAQLSRKDVIYDEAPHALGAYAAFMSKIGTVKQAYDWKALSMPDLQDRPGE
jgi:NitT/TauT family transport system substrate-binding protein